MYDIVVVGAGCMGTASAYYASKAGQKTLLLEQYEFGHAKGSSHGHSRIIRKSYSETYFVEMMHEAYKLWYELEKESKSTLIQKTGGLDFGRIGDEYLERTFEACKSSGIEYETLTSEEIRNRFPMIHVPDDYKGIYQPDAGVLNPYQSLELLRMLIQKAGVNMHDNEEMLAITEEDGSVTVTTNKGTYSTKKLIITIGAWIKGFLAEKGLKLNADIWKMSLGYYRSENQDEFVPGKFPIFIAMDGPIFYGFPSLEKPGFIKVAPHFTTEIINLQDRTFDPNSDLIEQLNQFVSRTFPSVDPFPVDLDTCLYTYTPDENFVLDYLPDSENVIIGAGFSGHGFKFTPLIGKTMVDIALGNPVNFDLSKFKLENQLS